MADLGSVELEELSGLEKSAVRPDLTDATVAQLDSVDFARVDHMAKVAVKLASKVEELRGRDDFAPETLRDKLAEVIVEDETYDLSGFSTGRGKTEGAGLMLGTVESSVKNALLGMLPLIDDQLPQFEKLNALYRRTQKEHEVGLDIVLGAVLLPHTFFLRSSESETEKEYIIPPSRITVKLLDNAIRTAEVYSGTNTS